MGRILEGRSEQSQTILRRTGLPDEIILTPEGRQLRFCRSFDKKHGGHAEKFSGHFPRNLCIMTARVFEPEYPHSLIDTIQSIQRPAYSYHSQAPRRFSHASGTAARPLGTVSLIRPTVEVA